MKKIARIKTLVYLLYFSLIATAVGYVVNEGSGGKPLAKKPAHLFGAWGDYFVIAHHDDGQIYDYGSDLRLIKTKRGKVIFEELVPKKDLVTGIPTDRLKASNISFVIAEWSVPLGKMIYVPELTDEAEAEWVEDCSSHMKKGWLEEAYGPRWFEQR